MRVIQLFGVLLATLSLTACLNSTTLVKLRPDGKVVSVKVNNPLGSRMLALTAMVGASSVRRFTCAPEIVESTDRLLVAGMHLDFPTFGHVVRSGGAYAFVPAVWRPDTDIP